MHLTHSLLSQFPPMYLLYGEFDSLEEILKYLVIFLLIFFALKMIIAHQKAMKIVNGHWHHLFDAQLASPLEVYQAIKDEVVRKDIRGASFNTIEHAEGGILSANRVYLRIAYRGNCFDICAAPFGAENFFVSWWLGDTSFSLADILNNLFKSKFQKRQKTFYEQDTEAMFKETVMQAVQTVIGRLMETKGIREVHDDFWASTQPVRP